MFVKRPGYFINIFYIVLITIFLMTKQDHVFRRDIFQFTKILNSLINVFFNCSFSFNRTSMYLVYFDLLVWFCNTEIFCSSDWKDVCTLHHIKTRSSAESGHSEKYYIFHWHSALKFSFICSNVNKQTTFRSRAHKMRLAACVSSTYSRREKRRRRRRDKTVKCFYFCFEAKTFTRKFRKKVSQLSKMAETALRRRLLQ